jgi:imidazoleglycerol phosphate synthase glutamine amidotransferase subunit HisH
MLERPKSAICSTGTNNGSYLGILQLSVHPFPDSGKPLAHIGFNYVNIAQALEESMLRLVAMKST